MRHAVPTLFLFLATAAAQTPEPLVPAKPPTPAAAASKPQRDDRAAEQLGWQLGVQAWTFRDRTTFEAIDTAASLGLKYIELYPGQTLSKSTGDAKVEVGMKPELVTALQQKLERSGVKAMAFGVVGFDQDVAKARNTFALAKNLGIGSISCEPDAQAWDLVEKLAEKFQINVACHNHPKPSHYWNPETVLAAVKTRSPRLGACADTGHWPRSGLDTVASLKLLEGRIRSLHFKDIAPANAKGEDQPWGSGEGKARAMLEELQRQGFRGLISIEYETGAGKELEDNVRKCIEWFDVQARELAAKADAAKK